MPLKGTIAGVSGRRVFFLPEGAADYPTWKKGLDKEDREGRSEADLRVQYDREVRQELRFANPEVPMRVLREAGTRTVTKSSGKPRAGAEGGKDHRAEVELPAYEAAHPADLKGGTKVRLMGPPNAGLHAIVILEDQPESKSGPRAHAPGISDDLGDKTVEELRGLAHKEDINLHGASTKHEIEAEIKKARRQAKTK